MLDKQQVADEEEALRLQVRELPDEQRQAFYAHIKKQLKDPDTFAVLNYLFITGLHHFYLGKLWRGLLNLAVIVVAIILWAIGLWPFGLAVFLLVWVSELYALFRSQVIVQDYNNRLMQEALKKLS